MRRLAAVLLVALTIGCGDASGGPFIIGGGGNGVTRLRFFHGSPDGGNLQLLDDGQADLGEIGFGSVTPYIQSNNQSVHLTLHSSLSPTPIIDTIVVLPDTSLVTVIAEGPGAAIQLRIVTDARPAVDTSQVKLRVLHEAPTGGGLDVYVTAPLADLASATPTVAGITFGAGTSYQVVGSGTYQVRLTDAGTKNVVIDAGSLSLSAGDVRTLMILDRVGGGLPLQAVLVLDAGT